MEPTLTFPLIQVRKSGFSFNDMVIMSFTEFSNEHKNDKVEDEIVLSCFDFDLDGRISACSLMDWLKENIDNELEFDNDKLISIEKQNRTLACWELEELYNKYVSKKIKEYRPRIICFGVVGRMGSYIEVHEKRIV